ncbi:MAG TPA: sigma-54 dependent transcriptional regulator [Bacteroidota bacterium]|nr:sigma-54 dependent transcriptional regulator [Bacteroidota bacterium]
MKPESNDIAADVLTRAKPRRASPPREPKLVGESHAIREIQSAISLVAKSPTAVLITGESGTGKEVVARLIHAQSERAGKPFIAVNCGAFPREVIENELFGHVRGAFTGALPKKAGCFELADGGTLFFDELAEMHPDTQVKLLRAIELKTFRRLGGDEDITVDVRTLAATNEDISAALKSGDLREDLYYRFSVIEIFIPPLRERRDDIPLLVEEFLEMFSGQYGKPRQRFSDGAIELLLRADWAGNVRELKNVVERAIVMCPDETIEPKFLPERITGHRGSQSPIFIPFGTTLQAAEKAIILQTLASVQNNRSKAAKLLGLSRRALLYKLQRFRETA